jgi:hypothetical protein
MYLREKEWKNVKWIDVALQRYRVVGKPAVYFSFSTKDEKFLVVVEQVLGSQGKLWNCAAPICCTG